MTAATADDESRSLRLVLAGVLLVVVVGGTVDLLLDAPTSWRSAHVLLEVGLVLFSLAIAVLLWRGWWRAERSLASTRQSLAATREALEAHRVERDAWRASAEKALEGLGRAIDQQFRAWSLTPAEREVALLLLKGHGHKEVAALTGRSERTVRQHAVSVYAKARLGGRAELAAFFLQDLMLPDEGRGRDDSPPVSPPRASERGPGPHETR